jgi:hypothetical protein
MAAGLALQASAADDRDVGSHLLEGRDLTATSHHRQVVQAGGVAFRSLSALLAVHDVPEAEQMCRSLMKECPRRRGFGAWGARACDRWALLFDRRGCRLSGLLWLRLRLGDGLHSDFGLRDSRSLVLAPSRPASPPLGRLHGWRLRRLRRFGLRNCFSLCRNRFIC